MLIWLQPLVRHIPLCIDFTVLVLVKAAEIPENLLKMILLHENSE